MELNFENHHVVAVVVFMVVLMFCKQVLECMNTLLDAWQKCAANSCCYCHYENDQILRGGLIAALLTFSVCQPIMLVLASPVGSALRGSAGFWTVNFAHVELNSSAFPHKHSMAETSRRPLPQSATVQLTQVDSLLLVMPFALCAFCTTNTWCRMKATGEFRSDPRWDSELFSSRGMQLYEALFALETLLLLFALLALAADPAQPEYTAVSAVLATFIIMYYSAQSRCRTASDRASEGIIGVGLFAVINTLISCFVAQHWSMGGTVKVLSSTILALTTLLLTGLHMTVTEDTRAGHVILARTLLSCLCSAYFMALLAVGANGLV